MKRLTAWTLTLSLLLSLALPAGAVNIDTDHLEKAPTGVYGSYFYIGDTPIEPQSYIYNMLYGAITDKSNPNPLKIELTWEATPLHNSTHMRDEAMKALALDHPELNLGKYEIETWSAQLHVAYVSKFEFVLKREGTQPPKYKEKLEAAQAVVKGQETPYGKVKAAYQWLTDPANCRYVYGSATAEDVFGSGQGDATGLAAAFKLLMDDAHIACVLGFNGLSTWAYVELDGKYYVVDFKAGESMFLQGSVNHLSNENAPYYMRYVGQGSGLSAAAADTPYVAPGTSVTVTVAAPEHGTAVVKNGEKTLTVGTHNLPEGTTLTVKLSPEDNYLFDWKSADKTWEYTGVQNVYQIPNIRKALTVKPVFSEEPGPSLVTVEVKPVMVGKGTVKVSYQENENSPVVELATGKNLVPQGLPLSVVLTPELGYQAKQVIQNEYKLAISDPDGQEEIDPDTQLPVNKFDKETTYYVRKIQGTNDPTLEEIEDIETSMIESEWSQDITAEFEPIDAADTVTVTLQETGKGAIMVEQGDGETPQSFAPLLENNRAIKGSDLKVTLAPEAGNRLTAFQVGGSDELGKVKDGVYTIEKVENDVTLSATFAADPTAINGVELNKTALSLKVGDTETLTATVTPAEAVIKTVTWTSSAPAVASVENGKVTAHSAGTAEITATSADLNFSATCTVTVTASNDSGSSEGGGSTGGGGGGGGGPPAPKPTETESSVSVKPTDVQAALDEAAKTGNKTLVLTPEISKEAAGAVAVDLPKTVLDELAKDADTALRLELPAASLTLPGSALAALKAGDAQVSLAQKEGTVTLGVTSGGKDAGALPLTLSLPGKDYGPGFVAVLVDEAGQETPIRKSALVDGTMEIPLTGSATVKIQDRSKAFPDTTAHWAGDAVAFVTARGLFGGVSETSFAPDLSMTRGMLATVLYRLEDMPATDAGQVFPDVADPTQYYYDGVSWAARNGVVSGTGDGFAPEGPVTREQIALILHRYAQWLGRDTAGTGELDGFVDGDRVSSWAAEAVGWAVAQGLMSGKDGGRLDPGGTASRAEVAVMLQRLVRQLATGK